MSVRALSGSPKTSTSLKGVVVILAGAGVRAELRPEGINPVAVKNPILVGNVREYCMNTYLGKQHVPLRSCIACGRSKPKSNLVRIVATLDGAVKLDLDSTLPGRGAYLCNGGACSHESLSKARMEYALRCGLDSSNWDVFLSNVKILCQ